MPRPFLDIIDLDESHSPAILSIFNEAILNTTALYDYAPRPPESMTAWFAAKRVGGYPVIGAESPDGTLLGFATYGPFRPFPAYKYTVEHSLYIEKSHRAQGLGRILLERLIARAQSQDYHTLIGVIDSENTASIHLHEILGFRRCAEMREAGYKFNRWLDVVFYQLILPTPRNPADG
jgi:phosphinothricin acetyltransferase